MRTGFIRAIFGLAAVTTLAGCETFGDPRHVFGAEKPTPDEFAVIANAPLRMPLTRSLPEPQPGAASPLAPSPGQDAIRALMGEGAATAPAGGAGEQELLSAANAASANPEIRAQLEVEVADDPNKPYEPPSLFDLFSEENEGVASAELLEPNVEARRLSGDGVAAAPVNPKEALRGPREARGEGAGLYYDTTHTGGRPDNRLPVEGTGPAFE